MGLYNRSFCELNINLDELERINENMVTNSFVYKYKDMIIKKYWNYTDFAISEDVFDKLCTIDNKHFIKLYEMFTIILDDEYKEKYDKFQEGKRFFYIDGYTAKYYQSSSINPMLEKSNYLINSIEGLKELVEILSKNKIMMHDTKTLNTIINSSGIIIIDPDYYEISNQDIEIIKNNNYEELLQLLRTMFIHYAVLKKYDILKLFDKYSSDNSLESVSYIENELKKVKRPIDLLER